MKKGIFEFLSLFFFFWLIKSLCKCKSHSNLAVYMLKLHLFFLIEFNSNYENMEDRCIIRHWYCFVLLLINKGIFESYCWCGKYHTMEIADTCSCYSYMCNINLLQCDRVYRIALLCQETSFFLFCLKMDWNGRYFDSILDEFTCGSFFA